MKTFPLLVLFAILFAQTSFAQSDGCEDGWCWGSDPGAAKEKYALFSDNLQLKDYANAIAPFEWLYDNTPNLNVGLYIKGVDLYEELLKKEESGGTDPQKIIAYQDMILKLYDDRIKNFGEESDVLERKGRKFYFYYKDREDPEKWEKMYDLYKKIFELNGKETSRTNFTFYMLASVNLAARKKITEEEILADYEAISAAIEENENASSGSEAENWADLQGKVDGLLAKAVKIDCEFVRTKMGDVLKNNPDDIQTAKRAIKYMLNDKCTDDPLFLIAAQNVYEQEPTAGLASTIAQKYQIEKDYDKAIEWKEKGIELAGEDTEKKAELTYDIALLKSVQGKKAESRKLAMQAIEFDNSIAGKSYELIGDLYMRSSSDCSDPNPVKARAVFLAAYDMYAKAGNSSKMAQARAQFPSLQDIFTMGMAEGESISVGCWVGVSTQLRKRPSE
ncbi:tetratricopeptide repeat protein [Chondrinema litorale]|uniref:tetratricopeptide repeat protein n=1 Tax=Chondrinema litorale TaxID=2994555 RepID=UPI002543D028|nr:tetratricopeptide repeat protein [Chondrinema litorale]UZR92634.1 tetratricopeptide repeat protein [Chondrinema litorale]